MSFKPALPNLSAAVGAWAQKLQFVVVGKRLVDGLVEETYTTKSSRGTRAPLNQQRLEMKPEGQRHWKWEIIHATPSLMLEVDDIIEFGSKRTRYRVMSRNDFAEYGFIEYEIVEDYKT